MHAGVAGVVEGYRLVSLAVACDHSQHCSMIVLGKAPIADAPLRAGDEVEADVSF